MPRFFAVPTTFDVEEADQLVWEVWRKAGLTNVSSRYGEQVDTSRVGARLAESFKAAHVVRDRKHLKANPDRAAWPEDVAEELFGDEPLLHEASSAEEEAARDRLVNMAWEYSSTSLTSPLNAALAEIDGYVLLQSKVAKKRPRAGTKGIPVPMDARFLTKDFELILELGVSRGLVSWRRATERFEGLLKEIGSRQPDLRLALAKAVAKELPSITGLLVHADSRAITAMQTEEAAEKLPEPADD